jgi:hypothetical protein
MTRSSGYNRAMPRSKPSNPFYVALLVAGVAFALTSCAFVVMMRASHEQQIEASGLSRLMDRHGVSIMAIELAVLAVLMFAAMTTDDFWRRRFEQSQNRGNQLEK